jgi:tRNA-dihydrouridine synthase B
VARKHIGWYSRSHPDSTRFRAAVNRVTTTQEQKRQIMAFFGSLEDEREIAA